MFTIFFIVWNTFVWNMVNAVNENYTAHKAEYDEEDRLYKEQQAAEEASKWTREALPNPAQGPQAGGNHRDGHFYTDSANANSVGVYVVMDGKILTYKGSVFGIEAPNFVELEVTHTEPGLKGNTATNTLKPATLETGAEVRVPLFINEGDVIQIDTRTGEYMGRA